MLLSKFKTVMLLTTFCLIAITHPAASMEPDNNHSVTPIIKGCVAFTVLSMLLMQLSEQSVCDIHLAFDANQGWEPREQTHLCSNLCLQASAIGNHILELLTVLQENYCAASQPHH